MHRAQSKANLAVETEKIAQSGNFFWNREGHKLPNGVSILTFIKNVGNFDGVKLHWVCVKHFMNVERLPFITLSAIFSKIAAATHGERTKSTISSNPQSWPAWMTFELRKSTSDIPNDVSECACPASDMEPRLPRGDWLNEPSAWVQRSPTQVNFADWRKLYMLRRQFGGKLLIMWWMEVFLIHWYKSWWWILVIKLSIWKKSRNRWQTLFNLPISKYRIERREE